MNVEQMNVEQMNVENEINNLNVNANNLNNLNNLNNRQRLGRERLLANLHQVKQQMRLNYENFIGHYDFYNIANGCQLRQENADYARFHYLCAVGNIEELQKWIDDYIRNHNFREFYEMANRTTYVHYVNYSIRPMFTAVLWNDNFELIRFLYSYGLELNLTDQYGHFPEEAIAHLPYFNPVAHLLQNSDVFGLNQDNYPERRLIRDANEFQNVIREIRSIVGEVEPLNDWQPVQIRHAN